MAGTTAVSFAAFRNLAKSMMGNKEVVSHYLKKLFGLSGLLVLGAVLLVLSGAGLLVITHAYGQLWFQVKMGLVLALILNGFLFGDRQGQKLKRGLDVPDGLDRLRGPIAHLRTFYAIQLILFLAVVVLAVIKPG